MAARAREPEDDRVERDGVEPVAHLTDDLPEPQLPEAPVPSQQIDVSDLRHLRPQFTSLTELLNLTCQNGINLQRSIANSQQSERHDS
jgi:hypothetical protein